MTFAWHHSLSVTVTGVFFLSNQDDFYYFGFVVNFSMDMAMVDIMKASEAEILCLNSLVAGLQVQARPRW